MRILFLSYFFEPDLSAGSFRNTSLFEELRDLIGNNGFIDIYTTHPNRYSSFDDNNIKYNNGVNYQITRIKVPAHNNGFISQVKSFAFYYKETLKAVENKKYDIIYASSSKLFTAFLAKKISIKIKCPLYLDIRDIFADTVKDVFKNKKIIGYPLFLFATFIEKYTFKNSTYINLVSGGFEKYFEKYPNPNYFFYTNGIDNDFINRQFNSPKNIKKIITYAGNIGSGQGLEKIIPIAAKKLGSEYFFRIIGDGGTKKLLENELKKLSIDNVEIINPVNRTELLEYYDSTTFLFLHLNDLEAFKKVLPSKIFEYGSTNKPIIAGVSGYAADFIRTNLTNFILFNPTDVNDMINQITSFEIKFENRDKFKENFNRKNIMSNMAISIVNCTK